MGDALPLRPECIKDISETFESGELRLSWRETSSSGHKNETFVRCGELLPSIRNDVLDKIEVNWLRIVLQ